MGAAIDASHWALRAWTGSFEMSAFQTLLDGKTEQVVDGGADAEAATISPTARPNDRSVPNSTRDPLRGIPPE